jgi:hypothetical protein
MKNVVNVILTIFVITQLVNIVSRREILYIVLPLNLPIATLYALLHVPLVLLVLMGLKDLKDLQVLKVFKDLQVLKV